VQWLQILLDGKEEDENEEKTVYKEEQEEV